MAFCEQASQSIDEMLAADQQSEVGILPIREQMLARRRERDRERRARARSQETPQQRDKRLARRREQDGQRRAMQGSRNRNT